MLVLSATCRHSAALTQEVCNYEHVLSMHVSLNDSKTPDIAVPLTIKAHPVKIKNMLKVTDLRD